MHRLNHFWTSSSEALLVFTFILIIIGTINIFSASFVMAAQDMNDSYFFLKRHLMSFALGIVLLIFFAKFDYHKFKRQQELLIILMFAMLVAVPFIGIEANGAKRWIKLGIQFQPSELAKLVIVIITACYLAPYVDRARRVSLLSWPIFVAAGAFYLVLKQPDMGTALVILGVCLLMYLFAGIGRRELLMLFGIGTAGVVYLTFAAAYRAERISAWLNPWAYRQTTGYQSVQALLAIGSGGFFGTGLGMGASKFYYLPEAHTDFAYAVLCQEMGFIGAFIVLILFAAIAIYGIRIAVKAADGLGMMLAAGFTAVIVGQATGNIAMVSGLLPVTGVPLPFISYGGTSLMINLAAVGILISVERYTQKYSSDEANKREKQHNLRLVKRR